MRKLLYGFTGLLLVAACAFAADAPVPADAKAPGTPAAVAKGEWINFTDSLTKASGKGNFRLALAVDHTTGNLFVSRWGTGVWMSADLGQTFARADGGKVKGGGPFSCYGMISSQSGGKLAVFNMNNSPGPSGYSLDGGKTFESFESVGRNWDYGAIDWESKTVLAARHEDDGVHYSPDMGKTWTKLELKRGEIGGVGVFGTNELVVSAYDGIKLSVDAGKTFSKVAPYRCTGPMESINGAGYWMANTWAGKKWSASVVTSSDHGKSWRECGKPLENTMFCSGPFAGKNEKHLVVAALKGIMESTNGGATWELVAAYPAEAPEQADHKNGCGFPSLGYDAARDIFYVFFVNMKKWEDGQLIKFVRSAK